MAKLCERCLQPIPRVVWIEGKLRNLQRRIYCLACSPWGEHNTRRIDERRRGAKANRLCVRCDRPLTDCQFRQRGLLCWHCRYAARSARQLDRAYGVVGESCWRCGYTKGKAGRRVLDFHHVNPAEKSFPLDCRHVVNMGWQRVLAEMMKCVLLCANCHREHETGLIPLEEMVRLHEMGWRSRVPTFAANASPSVRSTT